MTARTIKWRFKVDWDMDTVYTDESDRLLSADGRVRLAAPEGSISSPRGTVDSMRVTLDNSDSRYSPLNTSGALYASIQLGGAYNAPMYLEVSIDNGSNYSRVFTGVIKLPNEHPPYPRVAGTIEMTCNSRDDILLNDRTSTTLATFLDLHDAGSTEAEIIIQFLEDAGLSSGDYSVDGGLFVIAWAWLDDESPIDDIWSLAAACGGRFYCDQDGTFRYENMTHWLLSPHNTSQETLDKSGYGQMNGPIYDDKELYNSVTVTASPRDTLDTGTLWSADSTVVIPANSSKTITAKLRQPAIAIDSASFTAVTGGGRDMAADISIVMTKYAQRVILEITNANTTYAAELVALSLSGIPVSGGPSLEETRTSAKTFWTSHTANRPGRNKLIRGNNYVQTSAQAATLAEFLRDRYQLPRLTWTLANVPGKPTRRLGDRITVANADAMSASRMGFIVGLSWRLSDRGFAHDLEILDAGSEADGTGLFPYDSYFVIGTNKLGSGAGSLHARMFY